MPDDHWTDITKQVPEQGGRILARMLDARLEILNYCRFCFDHWKIQYWKPMPNVPARNVEKR